MRKMSLRSLEINLPMGVMALIKVVSILLLAFEPCQESEITKVVRCFISHNKSPATHIECRNPREDDRS